MDEAHAHPTTPADQSRDGPARLLTPAEVANHLRVDEETLAAWRCTGRQSLPFVRLGSRLVRYRASDVARFVADHLCIGEAA